MISARRNAAYSAAVILGSLAGMLSGPSQSAAQDQTADCGTMTADGQLLRANFESPAGSVLFELRRDTEHVGRQEVELKWSDECRLSQASAAAIEALPGVLLSGRRSLSDQAISVSLIEVDNSIKQVRLLLEVEPSAVSPGRYSGAITIRSGEPETAAARGEIPLEITRQEAVWGPRWFWNPAIVLLAALALSVVFAWFRALAISDTENLSWRDQKRSPRNVVAVVLAVGAGFTAWSANYLRSADYRFDLESAITLFGVTASAVVTGFLAFINPDKTKKENVGSDALPEVKGVD